MKVPAIKYRGRAAGSNKLTMVVVKRMKGQLQQSRKENLQNQTTGLREKFTV